MIGQRIKDLRDALRFSQKEFSESINIPQNTLSQYEKRDTLPSEILQRIVTHHKANPNWLLTGEGEMFNLSFQNRSSGQGSLTSTTQISDNKTDFFQIPIMALKPDCALDSFDRNRDVVELGTAKIPRGVMDQEFVGAELTRHYGDEMEPVIHHKDWVAYKPGQHDGSGPYVLKKDRTTTVRLVYFAMDGSVILKGENSKYPEEKFGPDYEKYFQILGRVCAGLHITKL